MSIFSSNCKRIFSLNREENKAFKYLLLYSFLFILPIVLANTYYVDDIERFLDGYSAWKTDGRPVLAILGHIFSNGGKMMPIFPLPLILSIFLLDYSLVLFTRRMPSRKSPLLLAASLAFCFTNLFLLENFSYTYESFGMVLALCLFIWLFSLIKDAKGKKSFIISFLLVVLSMCTYQAAIGAYLGLMFFELVILLRENHTYRYINRQFLFRLLPLILGVLLYKIILAPLLVRGYETEHAGIISLFTLQGIQQLNVNFHAFLNLWQAYFITLGPVLNFGIILIIMLSAYFLIRENLKSRLSASRYSKIIISILIFLIPFIIAFASIMPLLFLQKPVYAPRVFLSWSIFTLYLGFLLYYTSQHVKWMYIFFPMFLLFNLAFASAYGIVLNREEQHDRQIAEYVVYDLNQLENETGIRYKNFSIIGSAPKCKEEILLRKNKPLMDYLIPQYLQQNWYWAGPYFKHYRVGKMSLKETSNNDITFVKSAKPKKVNEYYQIYLNKDKVILDFSKEVKNKI